MADYHISEPNWRALHQATSIPHDLTMLMQLMADKKASRYNVLETLSSIKAKAEYIIEFCDQALSK
jgi:hypothetical protein